MDDATINRLVAERVYGWDITTDDDGEWMVAVPSDTGFVVWREYPNVCTDPAAWGALFERLCREKRNPMLWWERQDRIGASVNTEPRYDCAEQVEAFDCLAGRALALAALRAYGVEVER